MARRNIPLPTGEIAARYKEGENTHELARTYGVCASTVWNRLVAAGVKMRPCGAPPGNKNALGGKSRLGLHKRGGPLWANRDGYLVTRGREGKKHLVHRGCWEAYRGLIPDGHVVHHINGNPRDNRVENLACMTQGQHVRLHARNGGCRHDR